jgi:hypothetical protein
MQGRFPYRSKSYCCRGESDQAAVSGVGLMSDVCVLMAELVHDLCYSIVVVGGKILAYEVFESRDVSA